MSKISKQQYEQMLESHRHAPGNVSAAARAASVSRRTAAKYWNDGGDEAWMLPLCKVLDEERVKTRAALEAERIEAAKRRGEELGKLEAEGARADLSRELVETARLTRRAKQNAFELLGIIESLLVGCRGIEVELRQAFEAGAIAELVKGRPAEAIKLMRELARLVHDGNLAGETAAKLERVLLGDGAGVGDGVTVVVESTDDALAIIERANRAARRTRGEREPPTVPTREAPSVH